MFQLLIAALFAVSMPAPAEAQVGGAAPNKCQQYQQKQRDMFRAIQRINKPQANLIALGNAFDRVERDFLSKLKKGFTARDNAVMQAGIDYHLLRLTSPDVQEDVRDFEKAIQVAKRDFTNSLATSVTTEAKKIDVRRAYYDLAWPTLEIMAKHNVDSRLAAYRLIYEMKEQNGRGNNKRIVHYDKVPKFFLAQLQDPELPDALKAVILSVVKHYLNEADPKPATQGQFAKVMQSELNRDCISVPYQNALLFAMEYIKAPRQVVGNSTPTAICVGAEMMGDKSRHIRIRCRGARVTGRAGFDAGINFDPIAWRAAQLTLETALQYNQNRNRNDKEWQLNAWFLYTAFHFETKRETRKGYTNRDPKSQLVSEAYATSVPVIRAMLMKDKKVPVGLLGKLDKWTTDNKPANLVYDKTCPPIR